MSEESESSSYSRRYSVLAAVMLGGIMGPIDASIVNVVLPTITQAFGVDISTAQWIPTIYLLIISSLLLFHGRLGDILGYKRIYVIGLTGFVVASGLCGLSPSVYWLITFRAVQGLAAGMMMAVSYAIVVAAFPPSERGKALGINAISISAGLALGPTLGGFVTAWLSWRFVFFINIPIGLMGVFWARKVIPESKGQPGRIDVPGAATAFVALLSLLLFVNRFQRDGMSSVAGAMMLVAVVAGISLVRIERRVAQPLLNLSLFRNVTFSLASISALLNFMSQYVMVFLTPFYLQRILRCAPNDLGLIMTSFPLAVMLVAPFSGSLSDRAGTGRLASLGAGICAVSLFFMSRLPAHPAPAEVVWRLALFGLGTGIFQSPNNSAVMGNAPRPHLGVASGILATVRNVGMVMGIAAAGTVLYASTPMEVLRKTSLDTLEVRVFLHGVDRAFLLGAVLTAVASVTSLVRSRDELRNIRGGATHE